MKKISAWKNDAWLPIEDATLAVDDLGFLQGVVIVDRLRTIGGVGLDIEAHLTRFQESCEAVAIELPPFDFLRQITQECMDRNRASYAGRDFSLVWIATPGRLHQTQPTLIAHTLEIPWQRLASWYALGQRLITSTHRAVPGDCWSSSIKTRARLQYYLADREAIRETEDPLASAVLYSGDRASLTETSVANLIVVEGNRLISPPKDQILPGISLGRTLRLAAAAGFDIAFEAVPPARAQASDLVLLSGTTAGLWTASHFDDRRFERPSAHPVYTQLVEAWKSELGIDFVAQADSASSLGRE